MLNLWRRWASWSTLRSSAIMIIVIVGLSTLYLWHLGTLTPGLSPAEVSARELSQNLDTIISDPINGPQRLLQYGLQAVGFSGAFWLRLPSVVLTMALLGLFYLLAKAWFGRTVGVLATIILATTPLVVLMARSATPDIMLLMSVLILVIYDRLCRRNTRAPDPVWLALIAAIALSLYVPGLVWAVLAGLVIARRQLLKAAKDVRRSYLIISSVLGLVLVSPLILSIVNDPSVGKDLMLWPEHWAGVAEASRASVWAVLSLLWRTQYHTNLIIDRLPILDATQMVLATFGIFAMWAKARRQLYGLIGLVALGILAAGIDHNLILISLGLPAIAIFIAAGLRYLYTEWRSVFPHNPIPRAAAIVVMIALVSLHVLFGVRYSLVAWPHTVDTRQTYVLK